MNKEGIPSLEVRGELLRLLPERAVYWPAAETLLIADPHFGKAAAFRANGVAVPGGTTGAMLRRLDAALDRTGASRLVILGDLLHARDGRAPQTLDAVAAWRAARPALLITLVRGNHDRRAGDPPAEWRVECRDAPVIEPPFVWLHEPVTPVFQPAGAAPLSQPVTPVSQPAGTAPLSQPVTPVSQPAGTAPLSQPVTPVSQPAETSPLSQPVTPVSQPAETSPFSPSDGGSPVKKPAPQGYPICGHVHPAVALSGLGRALTLPCFYFGRDYALLPAFGEFTGTAVVRPRAGERVFVLAGDEIIEK